MPKLEMSNSISTGNVLTIILMIAGVIGAYYSTSAQVATQASQIEDMTARISSLEDRTRATEIDIAEIKADLRAIRESVGRIERWVAPAP